MKKFTFRSRRLTQRARMARCECCGLSSCLKTSRNRSHCFECGGTAQVSQFDGVCLACRQAIRADEEAAAAAEAEIR